MRPLIAVCLCLLFVCAVFSDPLVVDAKIQYQFDNSNIVAAVDQEAAVPAYNSATDNTNADVAWIQSQLITEKCSDLEAASSADEIACCRPVRRLLDAAPLRRGLRWLFRC